MKWVQLYGSLNILWHYPSLGLEWKLIFSSPVPLLGFPRLLMHWVQDINSVIEDLAHTLPCWQSCPFETAEEESKTVTAFILIIYHCLTIQPLLTHQRGGHSSWGDNLLCSPFAWQSNKATLSFSSITLSLYFCLALVHREPRFWQQTAFKNFIYRLSLRCSG